MVSVAEGLRMMQGGVDRTGFAKMAEGLGNPGLDLIRQRQEEARLQALLNSMMQVDDEGGLTDMSGLPTSGPSAIDEATGKFESGQTFSENLAQTISEQAGFKPGVTDVIENIIEAPIEGVQFLQEEFNKGVEQGQDEMATPLSVFGDVYRDAKPFVSDVLKGGGNLFLDQYNKLLNIPIEDYDYETEFFKNLFEGGGPESIPIGGMQDGGRVGLFQGGPSQQGQTQRGGLEGGRRGFGGPPGGGGGNQKSQKEVDIDQLKKEEEEKAKMVTTTTTLNPALYGLVEDQLSLQTPPEPMQEQSFLDTVSKYNPLQQDFQVTPNLSFGYDINPNLKDLSDINATAGFSYKFGNYNQGGPVSVGMDDNKRTLRISEDDRFIEAEQMSTGDTELYNYLVGGEIMPGLSFELGIMDDAVMEPGMRSPDDLKFFNIKKTF
tara:strand:- start:33 stop:1334 length:1302 start_codon:yes stop_codon:yes gene_type:complete